MNTFLEKVMRSPKAASRIAAASRISEARSRVRKSGDMTEDPVRGVIGNECPQIVRRIDVARKARAAHQNRLNTHVPRMVGVERRARPRGGEGELQHGPRPQQQGAG